SPRPTNSASRTPTAPPRRRARRRTRDTDPQREAEPDRLADVAPRGRRRPPDPSEELAMPRARLRPIAAGALRAARRRGSPAARATRYRPGETSSRIDVTIEVSRPHALHG